jgi:hypothetical protein
MSPVSSHFVRGHEPWSYASIGDCRGSYMQLQPKVAVEQSAHYFASADLVKSCFDGEHTESNHRLMYT